MTSGLSFRELLEYTEGENRHWHLWLQRHPEALAVAAGIAGEDDVAGLVFHICAVELLHTHRLLGLEPVVYQQLRSGSLDEVFGLSERARKKIKEFLKSAGKQELSATISFDSKAAGGVVTTSKRKLLAHVLMHGVRHWAQIATALRKAGYQQDWQHDVLFSDALD